MKSTENFKNIISNHLEMVALKDDLFAETLKKPNKNIDDCINYILNTVKSSGCNGFEDQEIFAMAIHYYDEDDIKSGQPISVKIVTNHKAELTEEELLIAKRQAIEEAIEKEREKLKNKPTKKIKQSQQDNASLFDGI